MSLDDFFSVHAMVPDIIKIDVEGAEWDVLRGASTLIQDHCPLLFLELHPNEVTSFDSSIEEIVDYLRYHGYFFYKTDYLRRDGNIEPVNRDDLLSLVKSDMVICVPEAARPGDGSASSLPADVRYDLVRA
jgi:hypothetical protein